MAATTTGAPVSVIRGTFSPTLASADGFAESPVVQQALQASLAQVLPGVSVDMISIIEVSVSGRRLSGKVTVTYELTLPPNTDASAVVSAIETSGEQLASTLNQAFTDGGLNYSVQEVAVSSPVVAQVSVAASTTTSSKSSPKGHCVGAWALQWSECFENGTSLRSYIVHQPGGVCPLAGAVQSRNCVRKVVDWNYVLPKKIWGTQALDSRFELPLVVCPVGGSVTFSWTGTHNMWKLASEAAYVACNFEDPQSELVAPTSISKYVFHCEHPGTYMWACSHDNACTSGRQRARVHVTDPSMVANLTDDSSNRVASMGYIMEHDIVDVDYNGFESDARASEISLRLQIALEHSPQSCADWIPASLLTYESCTAALASDLGFVMRARPIFNAKMSRAYYNISLQNDPTHCGTLSYLAELEVRENDLQAANHSASVACVVCGTSLDVLSIMKSFRKKGWSLPASCLSTLPSVFSPSSAPNPTETMLDSLPSRAKLPPVSLAARGTPQLVYALYIHFSVMAMLRLLY